MLVPDNTVDTVDTCHVCHKVIPVAHKCTVEADGQGYRIRHFECDPLQQPPDFDISNPSRFPWTGSKC